MSRAKVGFIGLGNTGSGMATNLLEAGFDVTALQPRRRQDRGHDQYVTVTFHWSAVDRLAGTRGGTRAKIRAGNPASNSTRYSGRRDSDIGSRRMVVGAGHVRAGPMVEMPSSRARIRYQSGTGFPVTDATITDILCR